MAQKFVYTPTRFMAEDSRYDKRRADHAVAFIEQLQHTKGEWAGKPFLLLPWQETIVRDIFGVIKPNGARQFNHCFVLTCKKSGKSELAAAVAVYLLCADDEQSAEIYGMANDRKQASIVFDVACQMIKRQPTLNALCKIVESQKRIVFKPTNSFYAAMSSEVSTKYGLNIHGCIFDELLGQTDRKLYDTMVRGAGAARKQPLNFVITTAGNNRNSICYEEYSKAVDILEGRKIDHTYYPAVFSAPDEADWTDPETWRKANPSYGKIVDEEYYHNACNSAKQNPSEEPLFRQFFLCQWTNSVVKWLPMEKYEKGSAPFDPAMLKGRPCYAGLDLASTDDIAALVLAFPPAKDDPNGNYYILPFFWIPRDNMNERVKRDHVPYDKWAREGYLEATDGNIIYYDFIERKIEELNKIYKIEEIAYDRWGAVQLSQNLTREGFKMVDFGQGFKDMSPASKELMRIVLDEKLMHGGNPVLRWMFENVYIETDAAGGMKPSKKKSREKIDGAVATVMSVYWAVKRERKPSGGAVIIDTLNNTFTKDGVTKPIPPSKIDLSVRPRGY